MGRRFSRSFLLLTLKFLDPPFGVDKLLLAGEKWVASGTDFHADRSFDDRTRGKLVAAGTADSDVVVIVGVDVFLHRGTIIPMLIQRLKDGIKITAGTGAAYLTPEEVKIQREDKSKFVVNAPGEYDVAQIFVEHAGAYTILEAKGFTVVYLPKPPKKLTEEDLKLYEHVDVLLVPGKRADLAQQLAPPIVIPLDSAAELAKSLGQELPPAETSLKLRSPNDLPDDTAVVVLG